MLHKKSLVLLFPVFIRSKDNTLLGAHIQMGKFSFLNVRVLLSESDRFPSLPPLLPPTLGSCDCRDC